MGQFCPETQNTNDLAVLGHFGSVKYKIFGASGASPPEPRPETCPVLGWGGTYSAPDPTWIRE